MCIRDSLYVIFGLIIAVIGGVIIEKMHMEKYVESFVLAVGSVDIESPDLTRKDRLIYAKEQMFSTFKKVFPYIPVSYTHLPRSGSLSAKLCILCRSAAGRGFMGVVQSSGDVPAAGELANPREVDNPAVKHMPGRQSGAACTPPPPDHARR